MSLDIYDAMDAHPDRQFCCPHCGNDDIKFATHDPGRYGFTISVSCHECKKTETENNHGALYLRWTAPPKGGV